MVCQTEAFASFSQNNDVRFNLENFFDLKMNRPAAIAGMVEIPSGNTQRLFSFHDRFLSS
jgi:hypothetical protein